jgi:hypothetical protein
MMKSDPNLISYLQEVSQIFSHFVSIFLVQKSIFENFWKWKKGCPGRHCRRARARKATTVPTVVPILTARSDRCSVRLRRRSSAQVSSPLRRSSSGRRHSHLSPSRVGRRSLRHWLHCPSSRFSFLHWWVSVATAFPHVPCPLPSPKLESTSRRRYRGIRRCSAPPRCQLWSGIAAHYARPCAAWAPDREHASAVGRCSHGPRLTLFKQAVRVLCHWTASGIRPTGLDLFFFLISE